MNNYESNDDDLGLYPDSLFNEVKLRKYIQYVLLNPDFGSYKENVKKILYEHKQRIIPIDLISIIDTYLYCNKEQRICVWNRATKLIKKDISSMTFFIETLKSRCHNQILHHLEEIRQEKNKRHRNMYLKDFKIKNPEISNMFEIINAYIYIFKIKDLDLSYDIPARPISRTSKNIEFNLFFKINYKKGLDYINLVKYIFKLVNYNNLQILPDYKINLLDSDTQITWNFNVHANVPIVSEKKITKIDGLIACHSGATLGFFLYKIIDIIKQKLVKSRRTGGIQSPFALTLRHTFQ